VSDEVIIPQKITEQMNIAVQEYLEVTKVIEPDLNEKEAFIMLFKAIFDEKFVHLAGFIDGAGRPMNAYGIPIADATRFYWVATYYPDNAENVEEALFDEDNWSIGSSHLTTEEESIAMGAVEGQRAYVSDEGLIGEHLDFADAIMGAYIMADNDNNGRQWR
jgi:hypothetical protein